MELSAPPSGRRQKRLDEWLRSELQLRFEGRVLSTDDISVDNWGKVVSSSEVAGGQSEPWMHSSPLPLRSMA
jgi:hypothetical protein